jgi:hypothetical protein
MCRGIEKTLCMSMVYLTATRTARGSGFVAQRQGQKHGRQQQKKPREQDAVDKTDARKTWAAVSDVAEEHVASRTYSNEQQYVRETEERQRKENGQPRRPLYDSEKEKRRGGN